MRKMSVQRRRFDSKIATDRDSQRRMEKFASFGKGSGTRDKTRRESVD